MYFQGVILILLLLVIFHLIARHLLSLKKCGNFCTEFVFTRNLTLSGHATAVNNFVCLLLSIPLRAFSYSYFNGIAFLSQIPYNAIFTGYISVIAHPLEYMVHSASTWCICLMSFDRQVICTVFFCKLKYVDRIVRSFLTH